MPIHTEQKAMRALSNDDGPEKLENEVFNRKMEIHDHLDQSDGEKNKYSDQSSSGSPPPQLSPAIVKNEPEETGEDVQMIDVSTSSSDVEKPQLENVKIEQVNGVTDNNDVVEKNEGQKRKKVSITSRVAPNAPKRNRSAYLLFIMVRRSHYSNSKLSPMEMNKVLAEDWQKLSATDREPYHKLAAEEKEKYIEMMKEYKKTDEYSKLQKMRRDAMMNQNRKRKGGDLEDDDDHEKPTTSQQFPPQSSFCPLFDSSSTSGPSTSNDVSYTGNIFSPEFIAFNKARESYRRQLQLERSRLSHEVDLLLDYDKEKKIEKQEETIRKLDEKFKFILKKVGDSLSGIPNAPNSFQDIESITEYLKKVSKMSSSNSTRKSIRECIAKLGKPSK